MMGGSKVSPPMLAIVGEAFLSRLAFGIMAFAIPLYARSLGMELVHIAVLISVNTAIAMVIKPWAGSFADRIGLKRSAVVAIGARSIVILLFAFTGVLWHLFALQTARGFAKSLRDPSMSALIAEHGDKRAMASAFAWYKTATSAAGALGKALAGVLLTSTASNYPQVFAAAFLFSVLPVIAVWHYVPGTLSPPANAVKPAAPIESESPPASRDARPSLWPAMGFGFLVSGTANMLRGLFPILATEYGGLTAAETGILYLLATAVTLTAGPMFGWLADNVSRRLVLMIRSIANIVASAIYWAFPSYPGFLVGKSVDEAGKAAFNPAWGSLMAEISGYDIARRGRIMGCLDAADDAGSIAGPLLASLLWSVWGVGALLAVRMGLAIVAEAYAALVLPGTMRHYPPDLPRDSET